MNTSTWDENRNNNDGNPKIKGLFIGVILVISIIIFSLFAINNMSIIDGESLSSNSIKTFRMQDLHSIVKHGVDVVDSAVKCLTKYGSFKTFRTFGFKDNTVPPRTSFLCVNLENNESYLIVTTGFRNNVTTIVTIYDVVKKDHPTVDLYIEYLKRDWGAIELSYVFSPQKFIIQPFIK